MSQELTRHILIVDDQRSAARTLRHRLAAVDPGFSVIDIPSGEEALLEIQQRNFDLVISDSRLPGMSGAEFMARAQRRREDLRFFVITSHSLEEVHRAFADLDVLGFFEKPVDIPTLVEAVSRLLLGEAALIPAETPIAEPPPQPDVAAVDQAAPISSLLADIQAEFEASAIALADQDGRIVASQAAADAPARFDDLVYRLTGQPDEGAVLSALLGDSPLGSITFHAGAAVDLFTLSASRGEERYTLVVAVRPEADRPPGEVVNALHRAGQTDLAALFGLEEDTAHSEAGASPEAAVEQPAGPESEDSPDRGVDYVPPFIDLDLEDIDSQLSDVGDLDSFWEEEASRDTLDGDVLSMDEAIELGLIPEELTNDDE
jgi:DNA-binding NarL/FixJ family response regulator